MKVVKDGPFTLVLMSRRNLLTLLNKLDREDSNKTLACENVLIKAEHDEFHYRDHAPAFVMDAPE